MASFPCQGAQAEMRRNDSPPWNRIRGIDHRLWWWPKSKPKTPLPDRDQLSEPRRAGWTREIVELRSAQVSSVAVVQVRPEIAQMVRQGLAAGHKMGFSVGGTAKRHVIEARKLSRRERRILFGSAFARGVK